MEKMRLGFLPLYVRYRNSWHQEYIGILPDVICGFYSGLNSKCHEFISNLCASLLRSGHASLGARTCGAVAGLSCQFDLYGLGGQWWSAARCLDSGQSSSSCQCEHKSSSHVKDV